MQGIRGTDEKQNTGVEGNSERRKGRTRRENQNDGEYTLDNYNSECKWNEFTHKMEANSRMDQKPKSYHMLSTRNTHEIGRHI